MLTFSRPLFAPLPETRDQLMDWAKRSHERTERCAVCGKMVAEHEVDCNPLWFWEDPSTSRVARPNA